MDFELVYSPFQLKEEKIIIPKKYREQLGGMRSVPHTTENWEWIRGKLIASYWMNHWYDSSLPTPMTDFFTLDQFRALNVEFSEPKFIRLNSLSPKIYKPFYTSDEAYKAILNSSRCSESIQFAETFGEEILVAVRDYFPLDGGNEYRVFVFEDRIKGICSNDSKIDTLNREQIREQVSQLFNRVRWNTPSSDCVMDVWLSDTASNEDQLIEFNSFGFWGQSSAGLYDWHADWNILYNRGSREIDIRLLGD